MSSTTVFWNLPPSSLCPAVTRPGHSPCTAWSTRSCRGVVGLWFFRALGIYLDELSGLQAPSFSSLKMLSWLSRPPLWTTCSSSREVEISLS